VCNQSLFLQGLSLAESSDDEISRQSVKRTVFKLRFAINQFM